MTKPAGQFESLEPDSEWPQLARLSANLPDILEPETPIWRYLSLAKFISMLDSRSLYFSRLDQFADQHEAAISRPTRHRLFAEIAQNIRAAEAAVDSSYPLPEEAIGEIFLEVWTDSTNQDRTTIFANCWHLAESESALMWSGYGTDGVAIQSTVGQLEAVTKEQDVVPARVDVDKVTYVNHESDDINEHFPFLFKHRIYRHEEEVRAWTNTSKLRLPETQTHLLIPADLGRLINAVSLAPRAHLLHTVVRSLLDRYDLAQVPVQPSEADIVPSWRQELDAFRLQRGSP